MRYLLNRLAMIAFFALLALVLFSQTKKAGARPCTSINTSSAGPARRDAFVHNAFPCVKEYLTEGPLYNPTFAYSNDSLSFEIPTMMWSALGKAVFVPATHAKVVPNSTTYWFLRVPDSQMQANRGIFVSSMSSVAGKNELLEYVVASTQSGIEWVRFPLPAQLRQVELDGRSSNLSNVGGSGLTEIVAVSNVGVQTDDSGDGFFNGAVLANAGAMPTPIFTGSFYGAAVIAQQSPATGVVSPTPQPGAISVSNGILVDAGQASPIWQNGQVAVGFPNTNTGSGHPLTNEGLRGLFTSGTAGNYTNPGNGMLSFGNYTQSDTWTQIGGDGKHNISEIHNSVISVLAEYDPMVATMVGCVIDAAGNQGCSGGLYGNAAATPFPNPTSALPPPATADPRYEGAAVIAQATSPPIPQTGNVLIDGIMAALGHNACTASSGVPCEFTWTITLSSGAGSATVSVPGFSICTVTPTQTPIFPSGDLVTVWVDPPAMATSLSVHAQDLQSSAMGTFGGLGNCN